MRLFVAFMPPRVATVHLAERLEIIRATKPWSARADIRWIPRERWHVTLAFLGNVDDGLITRLTTTLGAVAARHPMLHSLNLRGVGQFPSVLWVGVHPTQRFSPADRLARAVQRALRRDGVAIERRPWRAHVTIARLRRLHQGNDLPALSALPALPEYAGPSWSVGEIQLIESLTGPAPSYRVIQRFTLTGTDASTRA